MQYNILMYVLSYATLLTGFAYDITVFGVGVS